MIIQHIHAQKTISSFNEASQGRNSGDQEIEKTNFTYFGVVIFFIVVVETNGL